MGKVRKAFFGIFLLMLGVMVVVGMMVGAGREVAGKEERAVDITDISDKQTEIDNDIKNKWGNGSPTLLSGTITNSSISTSGDAWYYLNGDITANFTSDLIIPDTSNGNVRIVLNGYSISGTLLLTADGNGAKLSIFDKIPGKSGTGYNYNSSPVKYYKYNSGTGAYTDYSTTVPSSGTDVTSMPTWKEDSYIKVTGSALSPNTLNTNIGTAFLATNWGGTTNLYGINIVGMITSGHGLLTARNNATLSMYQCTVIGNSSNFGYAAVWAELTGIINMEGCKVYGNQNNGTGSYGLQPANTDIPGRESDIAIFHTDGTVKMYKCNIGAITDDNSSQSYDKGIFIKDVNFGNTTVTVTNGTVSTFFAGINDISGTIELVYSNSLTYTGTSPNLNFIMHGNDSDSTPKKGKNTLTVSGTCGNITTVFDDTTAVNTITINGTCAGISTRGNVTIGSIGKVSIQNGQTIDGTISNSGNFIIPEGVSYTIASGKSVGGTVTNNGTLTVEGSITNLTNNGTFILANGASYTVTSGKTLGGMVTNQGTLTIDSGATVTSPIENAGTLNVSSTVSDVYGYGGINVNTNGNVTIPAGKNQF